VPDESTRALPMTHESCESAALTAPSGLPLYSPIATQALFWRPRFVFPSPMVDQIPYLFWLIDVIRPRSLVQIGMGDGLVYLSICQAVEKLGLRSTLLGVDIDGAEGDGKAGFADLSDSHNAEYGDFSHVSQGGAGVVGAQCPDDLDVLVINGPLDDPETEACIEACLRKLSDRAVILVCQAANVLTQNPVWARRLNPAGQKAIVGPLSPGRGKLGVIAHGEQQPERLLALCGGAADTPVRMVARQVFGRLGQALRDAIDLTDLRDAHQRELHDHRQSRAEAQSLRRALLDAEGRIAATEAAMGEVLQKLAAATSAHIADISRIEAQRRERAQLDTTLADAQRAQIQDLTRQLEDARREVRDLQQQLNRSAADTGARADAAALARADEFERKHAERIEDIAVLVKDFRERSDAQQARITELEQKLARAERIEDIEVLVQDFRERSDAQQARITELEQKLARAEGEKQNLRAEVDALLASTSWRITEPLRRVKLGISGRGERENE
jgi:hypothetical protein